MFLHGLNSILVLVFCVFGSVLGLSVDQDEIIGVIPHSVHSNHTRMKRGVSKIGCSSAPEFKPLLQSSIVLARDMVANVIPHMDLLLTLFDTDGTLLDSKLYTEQRTFDEENVFSTYSMFIRRLNSAGQRMWDDDNIKAMTYTRSVAVTLHDSLNRFINGQDNQGQPNAAFYCNEEEFLSERNHLGLNYYDVWGLPNPDAFENYYFAMKVHDIPGVVDTFVSMPKWCDTTEIEVFRETGEGFIPTNDARAWGTIYNPLRTTDEVIVFCPYMHAVWMDFEKHFMESGLSIRLLHVDMGAQLTAEQEAAVQRLSRETIDYLKNLLVTTVIHEITHNRGMMDEPNIGVLVDVTCQHTMGFSATAVYAKCMAALADGSDGLALDSERHMYVPQGHRDAESFAMFVAAIYANAVTWYDGFKPTPRPPRPQ